MTTGDNVRSTEAIMAIQSWICRVFYRSAPVSTRCTINFRLPPALGANREGPRGRVPRRAAAGAAPAWGAEVVSSNIVGYQKITLQPGFNLIGANFAAVGTGADIPLGEVFGGTDVANATAGGTMLEGDLIQIFDAADQGYSTEYYFFTANGAYGAEYDNKWYDVLNEDEPTTDAIPRSEATGFWYNSRANAPIVLTTAGEVSTNSVTITIQPGFNCIVYPFPADFDFTKLDWKTAGAVAGGTMLEGDLIQIFDAVDQGYSQEYYFFTANGAYGAEYDDKWYDVLNEDDPTTDKIPAGVGFWYQHRGNTSFTITLPSPVAD